MCDKCRVTSFQGVRYKCSSCADYDLCQTCYTESGKMKEHDTHPFTSYKRPGASGHSLPALRKIEYVPRPTQGAHFKQPAAAPAKPAAPAAPEPTNPSTGTRTGFFYKKMSVGQCKSFLREQGVDAGTASEMDDLRRLVWDTHCDCIALFELNKLMAECGISADGCSGIAARRECAKKAYEKAARPSEPVAYERMFCPGKRVCLAGLNAAHMNGKDGSIVPTQPPIPGRATVLIDDDGKEYKIKYQNLTMLSDEFLD